MAAGSDGGHDEYSQSYETFPPWAPRPPYKDNARPTLTMVQWLERQHGRAGEQH